MSKNSPLTSLCCGAWNTLPSAVNNTVKMENFPQLIDPFLHYQNVMDNNFPNYTHDHPMLMFDPNPDFGVPDLPPISDLPNHQQELDGDYHNNSPSFTDPFFRGMFDEPINNVIVVGGGNLGAGSSANNGCTHQEQLMETNNINSENYLGFHENNPMNNLPVWPVPASQFMCSCCTVLREINHLNGKHVRNLEIHGTIGVITHAVLDKFYYDDISPDNHETIMFDFCNESIGTVIIFLVQYFEECKREGYELVPPAAEPISNIYNQTISGGVNDNIGMFDYDSTLQYSTIASGDYHTSQQDSESDEVRLRKGKGKERSNLALQRERTARMTAEDFKKYYNLPISTVAKILKVCPTVIKRKCREAGLLRWPYRKIKGIQRRIMKEKEELKKNNSDEEQAKIVEDIQMLEHELRIIFL